MDLPVTSPAQWDGPRPPDDDRNDMMCDTSRCTALEATEAARSGHQRNAPIFLSVAHFDKNIFGFPTSRSPSSVRQRLSAT